MRTGRAAVSYGPGRPLEIREYPVAPPAPDQILVRVRMAGICGSDLHIWRGSLPSLGGVLPDVPGHEMVGEVVELGEKWQTDSLGRPLQPGDRVAYAYFRPCERCWACISRTATCPNRYSHRRPADEPPHFFGAFAEYYYIQPGQWVFKVPPDLPDELVAPVNCALAQVVYSLHRGGIWLGDAVVVQGLGGLGLYTVAVARTMGAGLIIGIDRRPERLELARLFGADHVIDLTAHPEAAERVALVRQWTEGVGADLVVEVAGVPTIVQEGLEMLRPGGRYVLVGNIVPGARGEIVPHDVVRLSRRLIGVVGYEPWAIPRALSFLRQTRHRFPFERLVSHRFPLEAINEALAQADWLSSQGQVARAVIVP